MLDRWIEFFEPIGLDERPTEYKRQTRLMVSYSISIALILCSLAGYFHFEFKAVEITKWCMASSFLLVLTPFIYKYFGRYSLASNWLMANSLFIVSVFSYYTGGFESPTLFWMTLIPPVAGLLVPTRNTIMWSIAALATVASFMIYERYVGPIYSSFDASQMKRIHVTSAIGIGSFVMFTTYLYLKMIKEALHDINVKSNQINNLLKVVSHDISNPLTVITANAELIDLKDREDKYAKYYNRILASTQNISEILAHVREFLSVASGKKQVKLEAVSLQEFVDKTRFMFKERLDAKSISIEFESNTNSDFLAEPFSFGNHVLNNLVSNAIKFSKNDSEIKIISIEEQDHIKISVKDSGVGISAQAIPNLFKPDKQTSTVGTGGEKGTGFGMPLVKSYIDVYGGTIDIESITEDQSPNEHGTTIHLYLKKAG